MFTFFITSFKLALLGFALDNYLNYAYPVEYETFRIHCAYYFLYYYSKAELIFNKTKPHIVKALEPYMDNEIVKNMMKLFESDKTICDLEFIKDGVVVFRCMKENLFNESLFIPTNFDFIIYSEQTPKTVNKKLYYSIPKNLETDFQVVTTDYKFMLFEVVIGNESVKINLDTEAYNFYVVNNIINHVFLLYYLRTYCSQLFEKNSLENIQNYKIKYIDDSICIKEAEKYVEFLLKKTSYELIESFDKAFDGKKISDSIVFTQDLCNDESTDKISDTELDEDYVDLPDLIPIDD